MKKYFSLQEEEIDEGAFKCLKYDMIKEIIPKVGKRAKFIQKYEEYRESLTDRPAFGELELDEKEKNPIAKKPSSINWSRIERVCGPVPIYLKNLLKMCGYEQESSLRSLNDDDFVDMERFAREELVHLVPPTQFYFHIFCSDPAREFRLVPGHRKLLIQMSAYLNYTNAANELQRAEPMLNNHHGHHVPNHHQAQQQHHHQAAQQALHQPPRMVERPLPPVEKVERPDRIADINLVREIREQRALMHQLQLQQAQHQQELINQQPDLLPEMLADIKPASNKNPPFAFEQATMFPPLSDEARIKKIQNIIIKLIEMWSEKQPIKLQLTEEMINVTYELNGYNAFIKCPMCAVQIKVSKLPTKKGDRFVISNFSKHVIKMHFTQQQQQQQQLLNESSRSSLENSGFFNGENSDSNNISFEEFASKRPRMEDEEDDDSEILPQILHPYVSIKDEVIDLDS
ncbi:uncharacterized protein LOC129758431 isoform X2 [Uranotaenia lowii]|uniref:uncharacterized protein LOC129758431 isoform X2 n=1 Tax=Uranotaenia lowii TaxID=190385 RepID=UPI00247A1ED1|nr:uncharacterized protein LOC129758431 isoform X2 [Uranotaenia lowii]